MEFYIVMDDYIEFLHSFDSRVALNKQESRPYIGIVVEVDDIKYYAPLTSPKPKHRKMKNTKDFRKIGGGKLGAINFNNMIPVPDDALIPLDFRKEPNKHYRQLLQSQYEEILKTANTITETAKNLRDLVLQNDVNLSLSDRNVKSRCCNLGLLEAVYKRLQSANNVQKQEPEEAECVIEENNGYGRGR